MKKSRRFLRVDKTQGKPLPEDVKQILKPYFPNFDLHQITIFEGIPWYVTMNPDAYTDGNRIFFRPGCFDPDSIEGIALIAHEITHSVQYQKHGKWRFRASYLGDWGKKFKAYRSLNQAYFHNEFEIEARALEQRVLNDLLHLQNSFHNTNQS